MGSLPSKGIFKCVLPLGQAALEGRRIGAGDKNIILSGLDRFARRVCNAEVGSLHWVLGLLNNQKALALVPSIFRALKQSALSDLAHIEYSCIRYAASC